MFRPKILFLAAEDWFVRSHFLAMLRRAVAEGYETLVAVRMSDAISSTRADAPSIFPTSAASTAATVRLRGLIREKRPDVWHAITHSILLACLATLDRTSPQWLLAVTGRGYLATSPPRHLATSRQRRARHALRLAASLTAGRTRDSRAVLLLETTDDRDWVAGKCTARQGRFDRARRGRGDRALHGGALPAQTPPRIGSLPRLVRSKASMFSLCGPLTAGKRAQY